AFPRPGRPWHRAGGALAALCGLFLTFAAPAHAQQAGKSGDRRAGVMEGTHVFRRILFDFPFQPLAGFDELRAHPEQTILIVLGRADRLREVPGGLEAYMRRGGAVLLASDQMLPASVRKQVMAVAGVSISKESVICTRPDACYQGLAYCPWVAPIADASPALFRNPNLGGAGLLLVATNVPSKLFQRGTLPGSVRRLATLPVWSMLELSDGRHGDVSDPLFAVGGELGRGRILVLADHSIFI